MAKKRGLKRHIDDIKQEARILLWSMIKGFSPKQILDGLTHNVNFSIPKSVETFYLYWLSQEVPKRLNEYPLIDPFDVLVLLNPASPIVSETKWKLSKDAIHMFNSLSFRPSGKTNLYAWLFGTDKNPMQGRLCQEISDYLDEFTTKQKQEDYEDEIRHAQVNRQRFYRKREKPPRFDENDPDGNVLDERAIVADSIPEERNKSRRLERVMDEYKQALIKRGISERDATITLSSILEEYTNAEMAKQYNLSESSIEKILSKCKPVLKKILKAEL
ncbi:MAG: sigma-70 family RNA polymerase sigma factor [Candidatus Brocadia sinica]|nr:sigma-70 family RNA polymerase sigma factor [Candidatus Brocadia sinica]